MRFFLKSITLFMFPTAALGYNLHLWGFRGGLKNTGSYMYASSKYSELYAWFYTSMVHILMPLILGLMLWALLWLMEYFIANFIITPLWKQLRISTTWNP